MISSDVMDCKIHIAYPLHVDDKYRQFFHGKTDVSKGTYVYHYMMSNCSNARLINRFAKIYHVQVDYSFAHNGERD